MLWVILTFFTIPSVLSALSSNPFEQLVSIRIRLFRTIYVTRRQAVIRCEVNVGNISHTLAAELYPNPAHEQIQIILPDGTAQANYCLTDALGRVLSKGMLDGNRSELSLQPYRNGIYFLKITDGQQRSNVFKIVKQ